MLLKVEYPVDEIHFLILVLVRQLYELGAVQEKSSFGLMLEAVLAAMLPTMLVAVVVATPGSGE